MHRDWSFFGKGATRNDVSDGVEEKLHKTESDTELSVKWALNES